MEEDNRRKNIFKYIKGKISNLLNNLQYGLVLGNDKVQLQHSKKILPILSKALYPLEYAIYYRRDIKNLGNAEKRQDTIICYIKDLNNLSKYQMHYHKIDKLLELKFILSEGNCKISIKDSSKMSLVAKIKNVDFLKTNSRSLMVEGLLPISAF